MDHIDILSEIVDRCDPRTALSLSCISKHVYSNMEQKRRRLRFEAARAAVAPHIQELPSRLCHGDGMLCKTRYCVSQPHVLVISMRYIDDRVRGLVEIVYVVKEPAVAKRADGTCTVTGTSVHSFYSNSVHTWREGILPIHRIEMSMPL